MANSSYCWNFVIYGTEEDTERDIKVMCRRIAKRWCFHLCENNDGKKVYKGRVSLKQKVKISVLTGLLDKDPAHIWSTCDRNTYYIEQDVLDEYEKVIEGPWSNKDIIEKIFIPCNVRQFIDDKGNIIISKLRPFQVDLIKITKVPNYRNINALIDPNGNIGKSILKTLLAILELAVVIPSIDNYKDIMRMVMNKPKSKSYIVDMPKAMNKDKLNKIYSAIETVKDGYAFDDRYKFKEKYFDPPNIIVFSNVRPDPKMLSIDRWTLWSVNENYELIPYVG